MKILLIHPPYGQQYTQSKLAAGLSITPPLGLGYIAAVLEKNGYIVKIIDCNISGMADLTDALAGSPEIVGIAATTPNFNSAKELARIVRTSLPKTTIVIGGHHITAAPEELLKDNLFDIGVIGEGEITFLELVKSIEGINGSMDLGGIPGIIYKSSGRLINNGRRQLIADLDSIPFPAAHLFPHPSKYKPTPMGYKRLPLAVMVTSRGCPWRCNFCAAETVFGGNFRQRSAKNIVEEISYLIKKFNVREIKFVDDTFSSNPARVFEICEELERNKIKIVWTCMTRVNSISVELLKAMKKAGCWQISYGFESNSEDVLKMLNKGVTAEENWKAAIMTKKAGIEVKGLFMIGSPTETEKDFQETTKLIKSGYLDEVWVSYFVPLLGSEFYRAYQKYGHFVDNSYEKNMFTSPQFVSNSMPKDRMVYFKSKVIKEFYFSPRVVMNYLKRLSSFGQFIRLTIAAYAVLQLGASRVKHESIIN